MDKQQLTREICYAFRDILFREGGKAVLPVRHVPTMDLGSPGLHTNVTLGDIDMSRFSDICYTFPGVSDDEVIFFIEKLISEDPFKPRLAAKRLALLAPGIAWKELGIQYEQKVRLYQVMELARRSGAKVYQGNNGLTMVLKNGWKAAVSGQTVVYGSRRRVRRILNSPGRISWGAAMLVSPGEFKPGHGYVCAFHHAMTEALPAYKTQIDCFCRFVTFGDPSLIDTLMDVFDAPSRFKRGGSGGVAKRGTTGIWLKLSQIVDTAKKNPIRQIVYHLRDDYPATEVYRLFGSDLSFAGKPFGPAIKNHFLDVIADLEAGYIRTRQQASIASDEESAELQRLIALKELLR